MVKRFSKLVQSKCARCGKRWTPTCCDYSYKAILAVLDNPDRSLTIAESNRLHRWLKIAKRGKR